MTRTAPNAACEPLSRTVAIATSLLVGVLLLTTSNEHGYFRGELTTSIDQPRMLLLFIFVARAQRTPRWWAAAGCMAGPITYTRWLVVHVAGIVLGSLLTRRQRARRGCAHRARGDRREVCRMGPAARVVERSAKPWRVLVRTRLSNRSAGPSA